MAIIACISCGQEFELKVLREKRGRTRRRCYSCSPYRERSTPREYTPVPPQPKNCAFCGGEFLGRKDRKYCSQQCRDFSRGVDCAGCGKRVVKSSTSARVQYCLYCRQAGKAPVNHGSEYAYRRGCRCEVCRSARAKRMRDYAEKRKAQGRPIHESKSKVERECAQCKSVFMARVDMVKVGGGRFCSPECHNDSQTTGRRVPEDVRERHRVYGKQGSVRWRALRRAKAAVELNGGKRVFVNGSCVVCGSGFTGVGQFARYCSDDCAKRNMPDAFGIRWLDRMYLYDRDEWKCHLCGLDVVYGVDDYDPRMATLDHLVPQSLGGSHKFENLATAHLLCNSIRRELPVDEFRSDKAVAMLRRRLADSMEVAA